VFERLEQTRPGKVAAVIAGALVPVVVAICLYSSWHTGGHMWRKLGREHATFAAMTPEQRNHAFIDQIPLPAYVFDFYGQRVGRGDRMYFQVLQSGLGTFFTLPEAIAAVGRYYLLPAVAAKNLADANVVLTYHEDPAKLHIHPLTQSQSGEEPIYVSRLR
jgi:hypothetical protein